MSSGLEQPASPTRAMIANSITRKPRTRNTRFLPLFLAGEDRRIRGNLQPDFGDYSPCFSLVAVTVFCSRQAMVIGPTPPGTGVMAPATATASSKATSPTRRVPPPSLVSSSCLTPAESVGWVTPQLSAARPKCFSRARARRNSSLSIMAVGLDSETVLQPGRRHGVLQQAGDGHRADAAGDGGDGAGDLEDLVIGDVADQAGAAPLLSAAVLGHAVDADIDHRGSRLHPVALDHQRPPDRDQHDVGAAADAGQVAGLGVGDSDGAVLGNEKLRRWAADQGGSADDHH